MNFSKLIKIFFTFFSSLILLSSLALAEGGGGGAVSGAHTNQSPPDFEQMTLTSFPLLGASIYESILKEPYGESSYQLKDLINIREFRAALKTKVYPTEERIYDKNNNEVAARFIPSMDLVLSDPYIEVNPKRFAEEIKKSEANKTVFMVYLQAMGEVDSYYSQIETLWNGKIFSSIKDITSILKLQHPSNMPKSYYLKKGNDLNSTYTQIAFINELPEIVTASAMVNPTPHMRLAANSALQDPTDLLSSANANNNLKNTHQTVDFYFANRRANILLSVENAAQGKTDLTTKLSAQDANKDFIQLYMIPESDSKQ